MKKSKLKIHDCEQRSPEWYELRKKYPLTASEAQAIGNNGKGLETLCLTKMAERYSSAEKEQFGSRDTERGVELEDPARELYELQTGDKVQTVGFITDESISTVGGASPDGLVNNDGLLEIKAFADTKHFEMILDQKKTGTFKIDPAYVWQMQQQLLFTGRKWVDFLAYNPNYEQSLLIQRVYPDEVTQEKIRNGLKIGEKLISETEAQLKK